MVASEDFDRKSMGAKYKISSKGYFIETRGEYPDCEWTIKKDLKVVRKIKEIDELVAFASSLK